MHRPHRSGDRCKCDSSRKNAMDSETTKHLLESVGVDVFYHDASADCSIVCGDCLEVLPLLPVGCVDLVLTDPPYGTTHCKWDSIIPFAPMWQQLRHVTKALAAVIVTASQPFTTAIGFSGIDWLRYSLVWNKRFAGNFVQAKRMPLKVCEDVLVFCFDKRCPAYYPKMKKRSTAIRCGGNGQEEGKAIRMAPKKYNLNKTYIDTYPTTLLEFSGRANRGFHPTQKPTALMEYLIETYSIGGDVVLDFAAGSCTTAVAAKRLGRRCICIEIEPKYCEIGKNRLQNEPMPLFVDEKPEPIKQTGLFS